MTTTPITFDPDRPSVIEMYVGHLTEKTFDDILDDRGQVGSAVLAARSDWGALLYCEEGGEIEDVYHTMPEDLAMLLNYGARLGAEYIMLTYHADQSPDLDVYDWADH